MAFQLDAMFDELTVLPFFPPRHCSFAIVTFVCLSEHGLVFRMICATCNHLDANANTKPSLSPNPSIPHPFCLTPPPPSPLQYTTDDLDYSQFYDYSEGATDAVPTDEYAEPQVNEKNGKKERKNKNVSCVSPCVSLSVAFSCRTSKKKSLLRKRAES